MLIYILLFVAIIILIIYLSNQNKNPETKEHFDVKLYRTLRWYHIPEAFQGCTVDKNYIYAIDNSTIGKYGIISGEPISKWHGSSKLHFNGAKLIDDLLYVPNNPNSNNSILIFDKNNLKYLQTINISVPGSLTWIDYVDNSLIDRSQLAPNTFDIKSTEVWKLQPPKNMSFYGCSAFYGDDVGKSRILKFDSNWNIVKEWKFPNKVLSKFKPNSNSWGQFDAHGNLFCTGHDNGEIYVMKIIGNEVIYMSMIQLPITGQGFCIYNDLIFGIDRKRRLVLMTGK